MVTPREPKPNSKPPHFVRDTQAYVMIPGFARPAHRRMREKIAKIAEWNEQSDLNKIYEGDESLGIITSSVAFLHAREAAPDARILKLGMTYPLPIHLIRKFASSVKRCLVIEENDPYLVESLRAEGIECEGKLDMYRFDELNVTRVRRIIARENAREPSLPKGKPPQLCQGCPHRMAFAIMKKMDCIIAGDIGCYSLSVLPPFETMDSLVSMGASIGVGLGLRHALPDEEARRVISVIGDSTFMHSGLTGVVDMVYNPPKTGHIIVILDNGTTAMTGLQEHPGTGRALDHSVTNIVMSEAVARAIGVKNVHVVENANEFETVLRESLAKEELTLIVFRKLCSLLAPKLESYEQAMEKKS